MFTLPELPYDYSALEPYIDRQTMQIHHNKHHGGYVEKLNAALSKYPKLQDKSLDELLGNIDIVPKDVKQAVINSGGGHINHSFFWEIMGPNGLLPNNRLLIDAINKTFGSVDTLKEKFTEAAMGRFGSGWGWLVQSDSGLEVISTANQDSPLMLGKTPIIGIDVWEHAYYLKYQNRRADYINAWWNVVNWKKAEDNFLKLPKSSRLS